MIKPPKNKLDAAYRGLKFFGKVSNQKEFGEFLGYSEAHFSQIMNNAQPFQDAIKDTCYSKFGLSKDWWDKPLDAPLEFETENTPTPGDQLRLNKAITPTEDEGLYYIPIAAQAGYALHYQDPMYLNELERLYIPGNPFKGDRFRYFEIEGDSMYPTLKDGMQVIAEKVEPEYWKQIADYYIYIVVTVDQVLAKRLIKIDDDLLAMVSDNEELYPQQELKFTDVKEIWRVKRKLDWEMPPPRRIELKIDKKK